jgi:L-ascorbate metabolism protein UlaG (beta-lactamase superfamily)
MPEVTADAVTVSHKHEDHSYLEGVSGEPEIIDKVGAYEIKGVHIYGFLTDHDNEGGTLRGKNLVFKFRIDGVEVCHLGDIGQECDSLLVESLMPVNILLIPVGGSFTIDAAQAKEYVDRLMPDIVIPMHYRTKDCEFDLDKIGEFLDYFDEDAVCHYEGDTLEFDRADFDGEETKVVILEKTQN